MEVCYTVNTFKKEGLLRSTEKVFLGRLCEEIAATYLETQKKWKVVARNIRFHFGEVDLIAEDLATGSRWVVEVRGRKGSSRQTAWWLSQEKIKRLKKLAELMSARGRFSYRLLFLQIRVLELKQACFQVKVDIEEFEIQD